MGLLVDGSSPALASGTGAITTATFTPPDNSVLLIRFSGNTPGSAPPAPTITDSLGTPLTYTLWNWQSKADSPSVSGQAAIWTAKVGVGAAMTVTVTNNSASSREGTVLVTVLTGQDPGTDIGAHGQAGSGSASAIAQGYLAQATGGQGFGVCTDWDALGNPSAGTGCQMDATGTVVGKFSYGFFSRIGDDDVNGATNTLNVSLPGASTQLNWVWIEFLPFIVTPTTYDPPPFAVDRPPGLQAPNGMLTPWLGAPEGPGQPLTMFVTATRGGNAFPGIALTVKVLTNAAAVQNGAANSVNGLNPNPNLAITPNATGSIVYGAELNSSNATTFTANGNTTYTTNFADGTNLACYATYRSTATTTAATPVTLGATAPAVSGGLAQAEILAAGTLTEDASSPPPVANSTGLLASTVAFTPPAGSLLVAMVSADGGTGVATMNVTSGGLVWTELVKTNVTGQGYAGVWIARVPAGAPSGTPTLTDSGTTADALTATATVPVTDTGVGADTPTVAAAVPLSDTGAGADTLTTTAAAALADTGAGADTLSITAAAALADTATGADTLTTAAAAPLSDSGSAANTLTVASATPLGDTGVGAETLLAAAAVPLLDTGAGSDGISVATGGNPNLADTGTGSDTLGAVAAVALAQTATGADTLTAAVTVALLDAGIAAETMTAGTPFAPFAVLDSTTTAKGPDAPGMRATAEPDATSGSHGTDSPGAAAKGITEGGAAGITGQPG